MHDVDTAMSNFYLKIDTARQFHEKKKIKITSGDDILADKKIL